MKFEVYRSDRPDERIEFEADHATDVVEKMKAIAPRWYWLETVNHKSIHGPDAVVFHRSHEDQYHYVTIVPVPGC